MFDKIIKKVSLKLSEMKETRQRKKELYSDYYRKLEPAFIKKKVRRDLTKKYAPRKYISSDTFKSTKNIVHKNSGESILKELNNVSFGKRSKK